MREEGRGMREEGHGGTKKATMCEEICFIAQNVVILQQETEFIIPFLKKTICLQSLPIPFSVRL